MTIKQDLILVINWKVQNGEQSPNNVALPFTWIMAAMQHGIKLWSGVFITFIYLELGKWYLIFYISRTIL